MAIPKTTTLTFRIESNLKEALCMVVAREHRSIATPKDPRFVRGGK